MSDKNYLDEKEKKYIDYFGEVILVADGIVSEPHIDVYVFADKEKYTYITKGMEEAGFRELMTFSVDKEDEWSVYRLQDICEYQITEKREVAETETFENEEEINGEGKISPTILLPSEFVGFSQKELKEGLGLSKSPLYAMPITEEELEYKLENGAKALIAKISEKRNEGIDIKKTYSDKEQLKITQDYKKHRPSLEKSFPDHSCLNVDIFKHKPSGKGNFLVAYWTNFYDCLMPEADAVILSIGEGEGKDDFTRYLVAQNDLIKLLTKNKVLKKITKPLKLFQIEGLESKNLRKKVIDLGEKF